MLRVMEALTTEPLRGGATHTQLQQDTQFPNATLNRVLTSLTEAHYINGFEDGRSRKYILTEEGHDILAELDENTRNRVEEQAQKSGSSSMPFFNWFLCSSKQTGLQEAPSSTFFQRSSIDPVPSSTFSGAYRSTRAEEPEKTEELQQDDPAVVESEDESEVLAKAPEDKRLYLRLYLRSNQERDQERAREMCEEYGIDYEQARKEAA